MNILAPSPAFDRDPGFKGCVTAKSPTDRQIWRQRRIEMEKDGRRFTRWGASSDPLVPKATRLVAPLFHALGLRRRALLNTRAIELTEIDVAFPHLPPAFDGYTILHLTDLHVGRVPGLGARTAQRIRALDVDLAVITGD